MNESRGVVYIVFGAKAAAEAGRSLATLRTVGCDFPALVIGDTPVEGADFAPWEGEDPFDRQSPHNFQFKAGRVKPALFGMSPFERTLYVDCDTEFLLDITPGFDLLGRWELLIARHPRQTVAQLYNKPRAGWQHNLRERDATIAEMGTGDIPYWNSGVIFFRKCPAIERVFAAWSQEWRRFGQWDEQQALMRAVYRNPCRVLVLPESWNHPHRSQAGAIFHNYGRGVARVDAS